MAATSHSTYFWFDHHEIQVQTLRILIASWTTPHLVKGASKAREHKTAAIQASSERRCSSDAQEQDQRRKDSTLGKPIIPRSPDSAAPRDFRPDLASTLPSIEAKSSSR